MLRRSDYTDQGKKLDPIPKLRSEQETTILIVDDDDINLVVMGQQLENFNTIKCSNGLDALAVVEDSKADLILLDLMMPGMNGYEVCHKLRQKYSQIELPIILVNAKNHLEDLTQGFQTGANDYLTKPYHNEELISRVENQLRLSQLHRINAENLQLRSQIETYAQADTELRSSRMRLQQILESVEAGFIAFELPGRIFTLNQRAADLLGTEIDLLMDRDITALLSASSVNDDFKSVLTEWEEGVSADAPETDTNKTLDVRIEVNHPFSSTGRTASTAVIFNTRLNLFGGDEGTGILFLEDTKPLQSTTSDAIAKDAVELVSFLGRAQQNIRRIGTRLSVLTPNEISDHPVLIDKLAGIDDLVDYFDENLPSVSDEGEYRQQLVTLMRSALHTWEVTTQKSKIQLAEDSNIWAVSIDEDAYELELLIGICVSINYQRYRAGAKSFVQLILYCPTRQLNLNYAPACKLNWKKPRPF